MQQDSEKLHPLSTIRKRLRARGIFRTYATIWRWATKGVALRDGTIAKLSAREVGGVLHSSDEAVDEFFRRTE